MDTMFVTLVVMCALQVAILAAFVYAWLELTHNSNEMTDKIELIDSTLAQLMQILFEKLEEIGTIGNGIPDNPLLSIVQAFLNQKMQGETGIDYIRDEHGRFDGTTIEAEINPEN